MLWLTMHVKHTALAGYRDARRPRRDRHGSDMVRVTSTDMPQGPMVRLSSDPCSSCFQRPWVKVLAGKVSSRSCGRTEPNSVTGGGASFRAAHVHHTTKVRQVQQTLTCMRDLFSAFRPPTLRPFLAGWQATNAHSVERMTYAYIVPTCATRWNRGPVSDTRWFPPSPSRCSLLSQADGSCHQPTSSPGCCFPQ